MSDPLKTCYLHIGTEKTGTTTLQEFLHRNRRALAEAGILFTHSAGTQNNRNMAIAAFDESRRDDATIVYQLTSNEALKDFQQATLRELKAEVEASPCRTAVFSSEHFHSRLAKPSEIERLKQIVQDLGFDDIRVVVYLRRPADIAASLYSTAVRTGSQMPEPPDPSDHYWSLICDHRSTLQKWGEVFGRERLVPRLFIRDQLVGGHIVDDFLDVIGVAKGSMAVPPDRNESLSAVGLEVLRTLNKSVPNVVDGRRNPLRRNLVNYIERHFSAPKYRMPAELIRKYDEAFAESDEWVRAQFFPARSQLFAYQIEPDNTPAETAAAGDKRFQALLDMTSEIWLQKHRRIVFLENQLREKTARSRD